MVSIVTELDRLGLSAQELSELTSWPDALIEDYLSILRSLLQLAAFIDTDIAEIENLNELVSSLQGESASRFAFVMNAVKKLFNSFQEIAVLQSSVGQLSAKVVKLQRQNNDLLQLNSEQAGMIGSLRSQTAKNTQRIDDAMQEIYA